MVKKITTQVLKKTGLQVVRNCIANSWKDRIAVGEKDASQVVGGRKSGEKDRIASG